MKNEIMKENQDEFARTLFNTLMNFVIIGVQTHIIWYIPEITSIHVKISSNMKVSNLFETTFKLNYQLLAKNYCLPKSYFSSGTSFRRKLNYIFQFKIHSIFFSLAVLATFQKS